MASVRLRNTFLMKKNPRSVKKIFKKLPSLLDKKPKNQNSIGVTLIGEILGGRGGSRLFSSAGGGGGGGVVGRLN